MAEMKPMSTLMAEMNGLEVSEKTDLIMDLIDELGDDAPLVNPTAVTDRYVTTALNLLINVLLDVANDVGALPQGRDVADQELKDALGFIRVHALYETMEEANGNV